jgi:predicted transcriptional regulator of viral defense system
MNNTNYELLIKKANKVFDTNDLALIWNYTSKTKVTDLVGYYCDKAKLFRLKGGLYSTVEKPNELEIAQKALVPSYISFYTALRVHSVVFQWYETIFSASSVGRILEIQGRRYEYKKLKTSIFFNPIGVDQKDGYNIASRERAICDTLYLNPRAYFDNIDGVDIEKLKEISMIYKKPAMILALEDWFPGHFQKKKIFKPSKKLLF